MERDAATPPEGPPDPEERPGLRRLLRYFLWLGTFGFAGPLAPAVMAVLAMAAIKLARLTDGADARLWVISAITLVVTAVTGAEIAFLFVGAGLVMMLWEAPPRFRRSGSVAAVLLLPKTPPG